MTLLPHPNPHIITEIFTGYHLVPTLANLNTTYNPQPPCLQSKPNSNPWSPSTESLLTGPELHQCESKQKGEVFPVNAVAHGKHEMPSFEYKHICGLTWDTLCSISHYMVTASVHVKGHRTENGALVASWTTAQAPGLDKHGDLLWASALVFPLTSAFY